MCRRILAVCCGCSFFINSLVLTCYIYYKFYLKYKETMEAKVPRDPQAIKAAENAIENVNVYGWLLLLGPSALLTLFSLMGILGCAVPPKHTKKKIKRARIMHKALKKDFRTRSTILALTPSTENIKSGATVKSSNSVDKSVQSDLSWTGEMFKNQLSGDIEKWGEIVNETSAKIEEEEDDETKITNEIMQEIEVSETNEFQEDEAKPGTSRDGGGGGKGENNPCTFAGMGLSHSA